MIIKCDTFDNSGDCCYPVFVSPSQDVRAVEAEGQDDTKEVYVLDAARRDEQLARGSVTCNYA